ncbi:MAG: DUF1858 domain-containing protein [Sulfurovum sp.]|nr:DUF1858 domain-containing protein [Sulfurovum sp.]
MKEITMETKIADLLNDYEGMKDILIKINPKFKKLNNPVLRRTVARLAGVKQAAIVGGMDPVDLLNQLRVAVGQEPLNIQSVSESTKKAPDWIGGEVKETIDANALLDAEKNPLAEVRKALKRIEPGELVSIVSDFKPEPLIEAFREEGHEVYSQEIAPEHFLTFVKKG